MEYSNPDPDLVRRAAAPAASPSTSTRGGDAATQIGAANAKLAGVTDGNVPERLGGDAVAIRQRVSALADAATKAPAIRAEIARAFATFNSVAPTPEQMRAAEKAATDTAATSKAANEAADAPGATQADQTAADDAGKAAADAKAELAKLRKQRKDAKDALFEALRAVAKKVKEIKIGGDRDHEGGAGNGFVTPGQTAGSGGGSTAATPGKSNGGSGSTPAPAAQAPGATAPTGTSPATKTSSTTTDPSALLSALSQQAQQPQTQQQAATQPQAAAQVPQQVTQPQNQQAKDGQNPKHSLATDGVLSTDDIARMIGENTGPALTAAYTPGASAPISAGNGITTQYRPSGTPIQGTTAGGTPVQAQPAPTTGTSRTDLVTSQGNTEVSGRSEPARTATDPAPGTRLSSADPVNQVGTRPGAATPGGMPMSPGMMGAPLSSPAASNQKRDERTPVTAYPDREQYFLHGGDTLSEATRYTIAQNRPGTDDDPRRPGRAA